MTDQAPELLQNEKDDNKETAVPRRLRCLAVGSGKGGVGKTVISIGLSCVLADAGYKVLLIDADLGLANIDLQIGLDPTLTLQDFIFGEHKLADIILPFGKGLDVLTGTAGIPELSDMGDARRQMFVEELIAFATDYDFMIIDVGAGIGKSVTTFLASVPEVAIVITNEPTSVMDAYTLIKVLRNESRPPTISLIANMTRSFDEGENLTSRINAITNKFLNLSLNTSGIVLYDPLVPQAIRARTPIIKYAPQSPAAKCLTALGTFFANNRHINDAKNNADFFSHLREIGDQAATGGQPTS